MISNIDYVDLKREGPVNIQPMSVPTDSTATILLIQLAKICGQISDQCFAPKRATYKTICDMDNLLNQFDQDIPKEFRRPSTDTLDKFPLLPAQLSIISICKPLPLKSNGISSTE
jgi:hypothetical protein